MIPAVISSKRLARELLKPFEVPVAPQESAHNEFMAILD
jgi:hypothetical protein